MNIYKQIYIYLLLKKLVFYTAKEIYLYTAKEISDKLSIFLAKQENIFLYTCLSTHCLSLLRIV